MAASGISRRARITDAGAHQEQRVAYKSHTDPKGKIMADEDKLAGKAKQAKGTANEAAGKATGDKSQQVKGKAQKAAGKVQENIGKQKG